MRMMIAAALIAAAGPALADPASDLAPLLAAEEPCGLTYETSAIDAWIDANVAPDDLQFAPTLMMLRKGYSNRIESAPQSERDAICAQARRAARAIGLTPGD